MQPSMLEIFKRSGDEHIGQTIRRLAVLAAAAHRFEHAVGVRGGEGSWKGQSRAEGIDPTPVDQGPRPACDPLHTEVMR